MAEGPVTGQVSVPASKSLTARYLVLAALAPGTSRIAGPLVSRDSELMLAALEALGVRVEREPGDLLWRLTAPATLSGGTAVDCGLAGTVMRFVPPVAALAQGPVSFDGDEAARQRPVAPLLGALRDLGVRVEDAGRPTLPFTVYGQGGVGGGPLAVDASASSQFVSALLLTGAAFADGLALRHTGAVLPSRPHIEMTVAVLRAAGVTVDTSVPEQWLLAPGRIRPLDLRVEPDLSSAAPLLAAAAVSGGRVTVRHWPQHTTQAGDAMREILERMGAQVDLGADGLTVTGPGRSDLRGVDLDLHDVGELTPVVAALAALASSPSTLRGIAHLRGHETDRLAALERELTRVGSTVEQTADGLRITPGPLRAATWQSYHDHRMAMAGAVVGLAVRGVQVVDVGTTAKTYPGFAQEWEELLGR